MAEPLGASELLRTLRQEFLPLLGKCSSVEQLPTVLGRVVECLQADGGVLWRVEENHLVPQATSGIFQRDWAASNAGDSAGESAWRSGASVLVETDRGAYRTAVFGQSLAQVAAIPIRGPKGVVGSVELAWKAGSRLAPIEELFPELEAMFQQVLPALLAHEGERRDYIRAISRLMLLYDVGKVFHSTLEISELAPLIAARVQSIVEAEGAAVWLLDPVKKNLFCAGAIGAQAEAAALPRVWASDPGLGNSVAQGEAIALHNVEEEAWTHRWGSPVHSLIAIPLVSDRRPLGAIEAVRGADAPYFTEEDLRVLLDVAKQATLALRNAQRHQAERRVKELHALLEISKEITSTLDLDRVLTTTVNRLTTVIPADRCSISIPHKGSFQVDAISGEMTVDRKSPAVQELDGIHVWLAGSGGDLSVVQTDQGIEADREEVREKFAAYFEKSSYRALTGLLLKDEEGTVGVLVLEGKDPESVSASHNDLARIFANQATVAVRNALLYQQVPLIGVLHPLIEKKSKFAALPVARRRVVVGASIALAAFLVFCPWYSKPSGEARVQPERILPVSAEVAGVIRNVLVREGDRVAAGQLLAEQASDEQRVALARAQAQYDILNRRVLQLEAEGNLGSARIERARWQQAAAELELQRNQLTQTEIHSPLSGVVVTPHLEERVGQMLHRGDVFCQVVSLDKVWAEVALPEQDIGEVAPGKEAWLKLNTFPARKFVGKVIQVSPQGRKENDEQVFDVIVEVPNPGPDHPLRAGMMGRGKILTRRLPVGYLILRAPARWIWLKMWKWLP